MIETVRAQIIGGVDKVSTSSTGSPASQNLTRDEFQKRLEAQLQGPSTPNPEVATEKVGKKPLEFSQHALERMQSRGIFFSPEKLEKIQSAVEKADAKGSKEALLLTDDSALIVSVKNNKVVTVLDKHFMKEHVFTNIDATVLI